MIYNATCPFCRKRTSIEIDEAAYRDYQNGAKVQEAFPTLTNSQRETIMTGICDGCWENMTPEGE